ncbi:acetylxylan esterase [Paenibacillus qinlingensis]|uniref:Cephalosporin-C deacetylase n=1 Tax=Paenibacillus qinlingensis TaxID=1837343 RepID=A0ABU1NX00_9BACL|nr:acetylxylan esterase [Paenibacillus qinlingensis]MDR6552003.1 cephalosporin-C deacetylase [Paenibacillus qinlingensis]
MNAIENRIQGLHNYHSELTAPTDLAAFWERAYAEATQGASYTRESVPSNFVQAEVNKIVLRGAAETPIHAWLLLPAESKSKKVPCIVTFPGYTGSKGRPEDHAAWLLMGYAVLAVDVRGQGGESGNLLPQETGMTKGWITQGILDAETSYYRAVTIDSLRAVQCALEQPEIDSERVFVSGGSQGGGIALLVTALEKRIRATIAHVPNHCHMDLGLLNSVSSLSEAADLVTRFPEYLPKVLKTISYFDIMNLGDRIGQPVHISVGLKDTCCLPEAIFAAYNRIESPNKSIKVYPFMGHATPPGSHAAAHAFFSKW